MPNSPRRLIGATCLVLAALVAQAAQPTAPGWQMTNVLAAPEAVQAAAADERFVYAIANTQIAKYDRTTSARVSVSRGAAHHLNSGFLWEGRLFCAHSNYPAQPEQSEVKVLNVETMELTTFHDFRDFGGSLTWVVRRDGHWWCNFAHYGDENRRTFLAQFDDEWRELRRWTYPESVLRQLGRYSLSGGIWDGEHLLVTGHDDPVIFRLRLPAQGSELEFVDQRPAPFSGQGIAVDPLRGGLVGIQRANRQLVFATSTDAPLRLRVLTYNIHHGEGVDGRLDLPRIADVIRGAQPDLVLLQEVDAVVQRSKLVDQPAELARLTRLQYVFGDNIALQGGQYGNALLSRFPIQRHVNHRLPCFDEGEQRGLLEVVVSLPEGWPELLVLATHLDHRTKEDERLASAKVINERVSERSELPALLGGDLNAVPESRTLAELRPHWQRANESVLPTIPVGDPARQIDYVLYRPASRWRVVETRVLAESVASDHRPLLAVLELQK